MITIVQLLRLIIVSGKSKIHSPRQSCLSPGNSIVLEIESALLFISITNSCRFWGFFVEIQALFQTCSFLFHPVILVQLLNDMRI